MAKTPYQSPYETYGDWEKRTFCDNASRRGTGVGVRQCVDGKREFECTVTYNEVESDTMVLCSKCEQELKKEARKHEYKFQSKPLFLGVKSMKIVVNPEELAKMNGIEISVQGYKADPSSTEPIQVYIEVHNQLLRVHTWNGKQDPETVEVEKDLKGHWKS